MELQLHHREARAPLPIWWHGLGALLIAVAPAYFFFPLLSGNVGFLVDNQAISRTQRYWALGAVGLTLVVMGGAFLTYHLVGRKRDGRTLAASLRDWNRLTLGALALPWASLLFVPKVETETPWLAIIAAAMMAGTVVAWLYGLRVERRWVGRWGAGALALGVAAYGWVFSFVAIRQHHALGTHVFDLGIYDNIFYHSLNGSLLGSSLMRSGTHLSAHFDPILVLLSPLYLLYPRAEAILVLQSVWLGLGAIPLYIFTKKKTESHGMALGLSLVYLSYPALHGVNMYDFHSLALVGPLLIAIVAALELGAIRTYVVFVALALLVREDIPLILSGIGLYAIFALGRKRLGLITIGVSLLYLAVVKLFIMPDPGLFMANSSEVHGYAYYYRDLIPFSGEGTGGMVISLLTNPLFVLQHIATAPKLQFFALLFLPLLFLPLLLGRWRLVGIAYGFVFLFFSSRSAVHSIHFQYSTVLFPIAFIITAAALGELVRGRRLWATGLDSRRLAPALVVGMMVSTLALGAKFGTLFPNDSFRAGFSKFYRAAPTEAQKAAYAWVEETAASIPKEASVAVSKRLGPHASNRMEAYNFPREAEYIFVDRADLGPNNRRRLNEYQQEKGYEVISRHRSMVLLRKGEQKEAAPEASEKASERNAAPAAGTKLRALPEDVRPIELKERPLLPKPVDPMPRQLPAP